MRRPNFSNSITRDHARLPQPESIIQDTSTSRRVVVGIPTTDMDGKEPKKIRCDRRRRLCHQVPSRGLVEWCKQIAIRQGYIK